MTRFNLTKNYVIGKFRNRQESEALTYQGNNPTWRKHEAMYKADFKSVDQSQNEK